MPKIASGAKAKDFNFREPYSTAGIVVSNPLIDAALPQGSVFEVGTVVAAEVDRKPAVLEFLKLALPVASSFPGLPGNLATHLAHHIRSIELQVLVAVYSCLYNRHCATQLNNDATLDQKTATDVTPYRCPIPLPMSIAIMTRPVRSGRCSRS